MPFQQLGEDLDVQEPGEHPIVDGAQQDRGSSLQRLVAVQIIGVLQNLAKSWVLKLLKIKVGLCSCEEYLDVAVLLADVAIVAID